MDDYPATGIGFGAFKMRATLDPYITEVFWVHSVPPNRILTHIIVCLLTAKQLSLTIYNLYSKLVIISTNNVNRSGLL